MSIAAALYFEMAGLLKELGKNEEARDYFHIAAEMQQEESALCAINSLEKSVECNILLRDYGNSCSDLIWIMKLASEISTEAPSRTIVVTESGSIHSESKQRPSLLDDFYSKNICSAYTKVMMEAKISLILVLILQGDFQQSRDFVSKLERDAMNNGIVIGSFQLITSLFETLVDECEQQDMEMVQSLHRELYPWLTKQQNQLILMIIEELNNTIRLASIANK
eukprot:TRINITY_DN2725_c0_g1_i1.p1 TRINITY_DN2725_c0_g1~~TRINITY_DN2725_c0_g1_i1.p1  ORF type:complete len:223 (+),score=72.13 TRINITY_DN2725_c0_g1_i1:593-1261(+)